MRLQHFEEFRPLCPVCRLADSSCESRLILKSVFARDAEVVREGILECSSNNCQSEFPIIDGCPVILSNLRTFIQENVNTLMVRSDLSPEIESLVGDCCGPSSAFDVTRQHLSSYAWDHYGEFDLNEPSDAQPRPGGIVKVLQQALKLQASGSQLERSVSNEKFEGLVVDLGCGAGRTSFELARSSPEALVLGIDLHVPMIRLASRVLRFGKAEFPKRRYGIVYDRSSFEMPTSQLTNVDFWICNATALPFASRRIQAAVSLNTLDCVPAPAEFLLELNRLLDDRGVALLACPYDWAASATPVEHWIGGHSQRGPLQGDPALTFKAWIESMAQARSDFMLSITSETDNVPWRVRMHDRSYVDYKLHLVRLDKRMQTN